MRRILITGADGYLGSQIAARCLAAGLPVTAWVHARSPDELARRAERLARHLPRPWRDGGRRRRAVIPQQTR